MELLNAVILGISLAACAGLRTFLPVFAAALITRTSGWDAPSVLAWAASDAGLVLLGVATLTEWAADKIPLLDNALDAVQVLIKPIAGILVAVGVVHHLSPEAAWAVGLLGGAPVALAAHSVKATVRAGSTGATAGAANPFLSLLEDVVVVLLIVLALLLPLLALLVLGGVALRFVASRFRRRAQPAQ